MTSKKISISLPEDLLEVLDSLSREEGVPRSRILAEALRSYLIRRGITEKPRKYPTVLWKLRSSGAMRLRSPRRVGRRIKDEWILEIKENQV